MTKSIPKKKRNTDGACQNAQYFLSNWVHRHRKQKNGMRLENTKGAKNMGGRERV